ncbi:TPA: histidinol-phosphate aminotransferase family protein, partial [Campylobacter jejuni]|nr:histidinol-phosphate aminotransferase family protein [Campylobacter jejuni]EKP1875609.1 histidinol-phosphate aminotransferase family protein [Campylobacter coli]ELU0325938.1 histidinol-phosphate aminotransferase family protein [Campylobacter jejuni]HEC2984490.1 histidinol-phosphate aminotransferase family protein [Campylobacter jejuni]HEF8653875.1 histidinol-phosphate aminotransferase family protein [Campylobacter jejuni]
IFNDSVANFVLIQNENISLFVGFLEKEGIFIRNYSHLISKNCRISIGTRNQMSYVAEKIQEFAKKQGGFHLV